jgi:hypothetical protein
VAFRQGPPLTLRRGRQAGPAVFAVLKIPAGPLVAFRQGPPLTLRRGRQAGPAGVSREMPPAERENLPRARSAGGTMLLWCCYSRVQPQELISRVMMPRPVSMWVVQGMQGSKLRMARRTSMPLIWSSGTDSRMGVSTMACS